MLYTYLYGIRCASSWDCIKNKEVEASKSCCTWTNIAKCFAVISETPDQKTQKTFAAGVLISVVGLCKLWQQEATLEMLENFRLAAS